MTEPLKRLIQRIEHCQICSKALAHEPRPVFSFSSKSRIIIIGQAPSIKVHTSGVPWKDASGRLLREWLAVDEALFYDADCFALMPMGFCYPGKGKNGDLPPRKECAPLWHDSIFERMEEYTLIILIGMYSQAYYLRDKAKRTLTENVQAYDSFLPKYFPLPHPSPRNRIWLKKNPWFEKIVLPDLKKQVAMALN